MERLVALGRLDASERRSDLWTHPWKRAEGTTAEGVAVRFTRKGNSVYAILLGDLKTNAVTVKAISAAPGAKIYLLGDESRWSGRRMGRT